MFVEKATMSTVTNLLGSLLLGRVEEGWLNKVS